MIKIKLCFVSLKISPLLKNIKISESIGGAELQQLLIGRELSRRAYDISYITTSNEVENIRTVHNFKIIPTFNQEEGIKIIKFFHPRLTKLWKALHEADADIYYVRTASYILAVVALYVRLNNKKLVYCGSNDPEFDPKALRMPVLFRDKLMFFWGLKRADAVVAQNEFQKRLLFKNFGINGKIIHNAFFDLGKKVPSCKNILWVSKLKAFKNPDIFLKIAEKIPNEKFVMIGGKYSNQSSKNRNLYDMIIEKARKIKNLEFKGYLPLEKVEEQFDQAKLLINTSGHEGFPNTFLQAWIRGIPVISFVDPDNLIKENKLGFIVRDRKEMVKKINEFCRKKITLSEMRIKDFCFENFNIKKIVDDYERLFRSL